MQAKCACHDEGVKLQSKLTIDKPGDRYEQEADSMANAVMRTSEPGALASGPSTTEARRMPITPVTSGLLQREREAGDMTPPPNLESRLDASRGGGSSLPASTREFMESRFDSDFSGVRVHTGVNSEQLNRDVRSLAFTSGSDIYFGSTSTAPTLNPVNTCSRTN